MTDSPASSASTRADREGLPAGYRMRADAHYVDQLTARRQERAERERGEAGRATPEAAEASADAERRDRILAQLHEELTTLASASAMLGNSTAVARRLGTDLVRAQTWKALWLVKACALVDGRERAQLRARPIGPLVEQLRQGLSAECRLAGVTLHVSATDWSATPSVDEAVLVAGVTGAVLATLPVIGNQDGPTAIRVAFDAAGAELRAIEVAQDDVPLSAGSAARFFDLAWSDRPGGWVAGVGALTARLAAQQHGGSAACLAGDRRGSAVRLSFAKLH